MTLYTSDGNSYESFADYVLKNTSSPETFRKEGSYHQRTGYSIDPEASELPLHQKAFLNAISVPESSGRYDVRYTPSGGTRFQETGQHPGIFEPGPSGPSSAAGRYQFTISTWNNMGGGPFTRRNQDVRAWELAQKEYNRLMGRDLDTDLKEQGLTSYMAESLGGVWEGLKDSPLKAVQEYHSSLNRYGGATTLAGTSDKRTSELPIGSESPSIRGRASPESYIGGKSIPVSEAVGATNLMGMGLASAPQIFSTLREQESYHQDDEKNKPNLQSVSGLTNFIKELFGYDKPKSEEKTFNVENDEFPSKEDVEFAQKYGWGYGQSWERYFNNELIKIFGKEKGKTKKVEIEALNFAGYTFEELHKVMNDSKWTMLIDPKHPEYNVVKNAIGQMYGRAALASARSGIASLGFDPSKSITDLITEKVNVGGLHWPSSDKIYINLHDKRKGFEGTALLHESIHSGIEHLKRRTPKESKEILSKLESNGITEEHIVFKNGRP